MSVTETILQSFTFAFDTTKVIQLYGLTKLFQLIIVKKCGLSHDRPHSVLNKHLFLNILIIS